MFNGINAVNVVTKLRVIQGKDFIYIAERETKRFSQPFIFSLQKALYEVSFIQIETKSARSGAQLVNIRITIVCCNTLRRKLQKYWEQNSYLVNCLLLRYLDAKGLLLRRWFFLWGTSYRKAIELRLMLKKCLKNTGWGTVSSFYCDHFKCDEFLTEKWKVHVSKTSR